MGSRKFKFALFGNIYQAKKSAISIHKAQGLEYNSVKVVVTNEIEEQITHNIFYTAITRACKNLKIYWTPETQHKVLTEMKPLSCKSDAFVISNKYNIPITNMPYLQVSLKG